MLVEKHNVKKLVYTLLIVGTGLGWFLTIFVKIEMADILFTIADAVMNALAYSTTHVFVQSFKCISYFFLSHLREQKFEYDFQDTLNPCVAVEMT